MVKYVKNGFVVALAVSAIFLITGCASKPSVAKESSATVSNVPTINFDSYTAGTQIDAAASNWSVEKVDGSTMIAEVSSTMAKSAPNSLYIFDNSTADKPYALLNFKDGAMASGSVSFAVYIPSTNPKTVYVNFGVGKNNSDRYFELRLNGSAGVLEYENGDDDPDVATFAADKWHTINATWADGAFTLSFDGVACPDATNVTVASTGLSVDNIPTTVTFYAGDKSSAGTYAYIDDIQSDLF